MNTLPSPRVGLTPTCWVFGDRHLQQFVFTLLVRIRADEENTAPGGYPLDFTGGFLVFAGLDSDVRDANSTATGGASPADGRCRETAFRVADG